MQYHETTADKSQYRLEQAINCQIANAVREVFKVQPDKSVDTKHAKNANSVAPGQQSNKKKQILSSHIIPIPKIQVRAIFLPTGSCKVQTYGIGKRIIESSVKRSTMATERYAAYEFPQRPSILLSQLYLIGMQSKKASRITARQ